LLILLAGIAVLAVVVRPATTRAQPVQPQTANQQIQRGRQLYLQSCAGCHGPDPNGATAYPKTVPQLNTVGGAAAVDWALRTGRMPMSTPVGIAQRGKARFGDDDRNALVAYIGQAVGAPYLPAVDLGDADLVLGRQLFSQNCAACHGMNGAGEALGGQNIAPTLRDVTPQDVVEAVRIGPGVMPVFSEDQLNSHDVDSIAGYIQTLRQSRYDRGGATIGGKGPVPEGFVAWVVGLGLLILVCRMIGTRT
jgi:ubiquinol-cytochrome c reductase cytochrome c subunit